MMIKTIAANGKAEVEYLKEMKLRAGEADLAAQKAVLDIIESVKREGDGAVKRYTCRFDGGCPDAFEVPAEVLKKAFDEADPAFQGALIRAKANIEEYHKLQMEQDYRLERDGAVLGLVVRGITRAGIYVPGGTAAYPSTVLMNAIPAKIAGVSEILMVTPPMAKEGPEGTVYEGNPDILAAAYIAGVDRVFLMGGAQAVAALTFGTETVPRVDKIVGPGNLYVATAKRLLYGQVDIDMIAGPSEILIMADETADPAYTAADLMSQAEHDRLAASILLTTSPALAEAVTKELESQIKTLSRQEIIRESLSGYGAIILCRSEEEMAALSDAIAPEHLEIITREPMETLKKVKNAGSIFLGSYSPEPLGDYYAGTNHVLPTSGTARFSSPLGVYSFLKKTSYTYYTREALEKAAGDIVEIAEREGLTAHANSITVRMKG